MNVFVKNIGILGLGAMLLTACSLGPRVPGGESDSIIPAEQQIRPDAATSPAIRRLVENARQASQQGQMSQAESLLERAIRIEPKSPLLWHYLARLHLFQGHYQRAEGLATKSSTLIQKSPNDRLRADNWRIIAHARQFLGDTAGAQKAEARASALSSGNH